MRAYKDLGALFVTTGSSVYRCGSREEGLKLYESGFKEEDSRFRGLVFRVQALNPKLSKG